MEKSFGLFFHLKKRTGFPDGESTIYLRITVNGKFTELSTKRNWEPSKWNIVAGRADGKTELSKSLNSYLEVLQKKVYEIRKHLLENDKPVTAENIKIILQGGQLLEDKYMLMEIFQTHNMQGYLVGGSTPINELTYNYNASSNQLAGVTDAVDNNLTKLGNFHYNPATKQSTDYNYDGDGNLIKDNNKAISNIIYNYLNLPQLVHMNAEGNITYTYDAAGEKLAKLTTDSTSKHTTTTLYIAAFVYQQRDTLSSPGGGIDTLQFISHEEGRIRWAYQKYTTGATGYKYVYDFFEKDHLGNTRMVLTQEKDTSNYLASMEAAYRATEVQLFNNITSTCYAWSSVPGSSGIPSGTKLAITNPNDSVSKVDYNGTTGQTTGPSLLLKVMSGDTVSLAVQSYYNTNTVTTTNSSFNSVLTSLVNGLLNTATGGAEGTLTTFTATTSSVYTGLTSFLSTDDPAPPAGYPKAYLNWIFLDDQFNYVSGSSGAVQAAGSSHPAATLNTIAPGAPLTMIKNGYLYIWVSNETQGWDVFFDNLSVQYKTGPVLEESHYYPFGLTMAGISDKAVKTSYSENKYKYNKGSELQNKEFNDGSGLEMYETPFRELDPQLGRWWQIDPKPHEMFSPYTAMADNPILYSDANGDTTWVFGSNGKFQGVVNDKLKNQIHFMGDKGGNSLFDASKLSKKEANALGKSFRSSSIAFMGSKTASDMKAISAKADASKQEIGFVGTIGKDKEIRLTAMPADESNGPKSVDMGTQLDKNYSKEQQSNIFLVGHVHYGALLDGVTIGNGTDMEQHQYLGEPTNHGEKSDYYPMLYRSADAAQRGQSPAVVATPYGMVIYGTGTNTVYSPHTGTFIVNSVYPDNNSYILYQSLKK
jgi:RHS repeat-associated protein